MPQSFQDDSVPVIQFDPRLEISPFVLFRRLRDGKAPLLIDVRPSSGRHTLAGAEPLPGGDWEPPADREVVLFDEDGSAAVEMAQRFQQAGHPRVKALFGGLELYEFCLDPEILGQDTYLITTKP